MVPGGSIQPKDFTLVAQPKLGIYHLFFTRQDRSTLDSDGSVDLARTENSLGHAWSRDLARWHQMEPVLDARSGAWDSAHVWAPSIITRGDTCYMFYTGVQRTEDGDLVQRIGLATADASPRGDSLKTWTRMDSWIFSQDQVPWACHDTTHVAGQQFRDPFVMPDPEHAGHYLMFYVTVTAEAPRRYAIGLAKSDGNLARWYDAGRLQGGWESGGLDVRLESPHVLVLPVPGTTHKARWLVFTRVSSHTSPDGALRIASGRAGAPSVASAGTWNADVALSDYVSAGPSIAHWYGSEWMRIAGREFLGAYDDSLQAIVARELHWRRGPPPALRLADPARGPNSRGQRASGLRPDSGP